MQEVARQLMVLLLLRIPVFRPTLGKERDCSQSIRIDSQNRFKNVPSQRRDHSSLRP